jgi:hypothetical protein
VSEAAIRWKEYLEGEKLKPYRDIRSFFDSCSEFITILASKVENLPRMKGEVKTDKVGNDPNQINEDITGLKEDLLFSVG